MHLQLKRRSEGCLRCNDVQWCPPRRILTPDAIFGLSLLALEMTIRGHQNPGGDVILLSSVCGPSL